MNRDIVFYNYMTPEQQDLLNRSMQQASFRKGQIVHRHGDSCVGLIFVRKGRLAFSILSEEGREITVFRVEKGEVCILSAACILRSLEFESQITAEVNTEVSILPAPTLSQLMNANHDVERLVYKQAVWQYSGVLRTLQQILFLSLEKRLATFLLDECRRRKAQSLFRDPRADRPLHRLLPRGGHPDAQPVCRSGACEAGPGKRHRPRPRRPGGHFAVRGSVATTSINIEKSRCVKFFTHLLFAVKRN